MLNQKVLDTKILTGFRGCDSSRAESFGTSTSVTPTYDGWLVASAKSNSSTGAAPVIRIGTPGGTIFAESLGIVGVGNLLFVGAPVKAGVTYTIYHFRCDMNIVTNYY